MKRKPITTIRSAHGANAAAAPGRSAGALASHGALGLPNSPPDVTAWVQSVACCRGTDLIASGAGDGALRLWGVTQSKAGLAGGLEAIGMLPARGFVNGVSFARSGRFVVAAMGQEPRMGRWARDGEARNGLLLHTLAGAE